MIEVQYFDIQGYDKTVTTVSTNEVLPKRRDGQMYLDEAKRTIKQYNKLINNG